MKQLVAVEQRRIGISSWCAPKRLLVERKPLASRRRKLRIDQHPIHRADSSAMGAVQIQESRWQRRLGAQWHPSASVRQAPRGQDKGGIDGERIEVVALGSEPRVPLGGVLTKEKL